MTTSKAKRAQIITNAARTEETPVKLDLTKITAAEFPVVRRIPDMTSIFPRVVVECPPAWGDPADVKTWRLMPVRQMLKVLRMINVAQQEIDTPLDAYAFDLSSMNSEQLQTILDAEGTSVNPRRMAELMAKFMIGSPDGKHGDPEHLLSLPYYTLFRPLMQKMLREATEEVSYFLAEDLSAPEVRESAE